LARGSAERGMGELDLFTNRVERHRDGGATEILRVRLEGTDESTLTQACREGGQKVAVIGAGMNDIAAAAIGPHERNGLGFPASTAQDRLRGGTVQRRARNAIGAELISGNETIQGVGMRGPDR